MSQEVAETGWISLAEMFGVSVRTMMRRKPELEAAGVIFYRMDGAPPHKIMQYFPSLVKAWISKKSAKGEFL